MNQFSQQISVFAAIYQATQLVHNIATTGKCSYLDFKALVEFLFNDELLSPNLNYHSIRTLKTGLTSCWQHLSMHTASAAALQVNRYVGLLCALQSKLKQHSALTHIGNEVKQCYQAQTDFDQHHETIIQELAKTYQKHISTNAATIMIRGTQGHLQQPFNVAKIRCLLLCGFRFAMIWQQLGGRRWHILLRRNRAIEECQQLLKHSEQLA